MHKEIFPPSRKARSAQLTQTAWPEKATSGYAHDPIMANFGEYAFCGVAQSLSASISSPNYFK
ncbi:MAG: hypothetical protein ACYC2W_01295 [Desulfurivibrionaceae bacterium]